MFKSFFRAAIPAAMLMAAAACGQSDLSQLEDDSASGVAPVAGTASADQKIKIVGSSTVAPFSRTIAERFGATTSFATPIVESTGTGGGFKAFCAGVGPGEPSIANASRPIQDAERNLCVAAGVSSITEIRSAMTALSLQTPRKALSSTLPSANSSLLWPRIFRTARAVSNRTHT